MRSNILLPLALFFLLLSACSDDKPSPEPGGDLTSEIEVQSPTFNVINIMRASGLQVRVPKEMERPQMQTEGYLLDVNNGVPLEVYEYESAEDLNEVKGGISPDGGTIGGKVVAWGSPVHLYNTDKIILVYLGNDADTRQSLATMFGPEFAGTK